MSALHRKLVRDLYQIRGQALAISLVIAAGIAMLVMSLSTLASIRWSKDAFYERYGFADVFAQLKRAPWGVAERIAELPGVAAVEARIVFDVTIDVEGMAEPAVGRLISVPNVGRPRLNGLHLRRGRWLAPSRRNEVLVGEPFADSHDLHPGDEVIAIINGRRQKLKIVGIVLSPEYLIQINVGSLLPDDRRFGIFYMAYEGVAAALDMDGAFNSLSLSLLRGASEPEVIRRLDLLTEPYGGVGAYGRSDQVSHQYISDEIRQLRGMGIVAPTIFLSVAAFLLNVVISRLISTQREQIAALKAFGFTRREIGAHYLQLVCAIPWMGTLLGVAAGAWMGSGVARMYARFYRFPVFSFQLEPAVVVLALTISTLAAMLGTLSAVRKAVRLAPAEAMRPEPPATYRPSLVEKSGLGRWLPQTARMVLRNLERRPIKALLSILGIAMAVAVLILGSFMLDAVTYIMDFQFRLAQQQDLTVTFVEPASSRAVHEIEHLRGVMQHQAFRTVPVRLRLGHRHERTSIMGLENGTRLFRVMDDEERQVPFPEQGLLLSDKLAKQLHAAPGDFVTVEIMEGERQTRTLPVAALVREYSGMNAYMRLDQVRLLMEEGETASGVFVKMDNQQAEWLYRTLKDRPRVASVTIKSAMIKSFEDTVAENLLRMRTFNILFATIIAFGVVYNTARISLSERTRELSTLRVIGFTRREVSDILLGELALLTVAALPMGMLLGYVFAALMTLGLDTEMYRIPLVIQPGTYAFAGLVVLVASIISALIVRRHIDILDLVAVLKSKE